jgi:mRNA interferase RelE/StbE
MTEQYQLIIEPSAERNLKKLSRDTAKRVYDKMLSLRANPRPSGCLKLTDTRTWRIRSGIYRILYEINDDSHVVYVSKIDDRSDVYRK